MSLIGVTIISSQMDGVAKLSADTPAVLKKISALETENKTFKKGMYVFTWMYLQYLYIYVFTIPDSFIQEIYHNIFCS